MFCSAKSASRFVIASYLGKNEMWQAEHMLILGVEKAKTARSNISAPLSPSACGKTNLAMLIPPEGYKKKGYKVGVRRR